MALYKKSMSKKARILLACGCLCLALGTGSGALIHPPSAAASDWFDGARGLLLGLAIGLNLGAVLLGKASGANRPDRSEGA